MKCQKNIYPYNENNVCLVISGVNMDYAFSNEEMGTFSLRTSCVVSPNVRCIKEKIECFLNENEMIYAIYSLSYLRKWSAQKVINLAKTESSLWFVDYLLNGKNNPHLLKAKTTPEIFSYFINNKGVIPFFIKEQKIMESIIMTMEDISYGLYSDYEYIADFYNNEDEGVNINLEEVDFIKRIENNYKDILSSFKK